MHERILHRLQALVLSSRYAVTVHGFEEMEDDGLSIFDVEHCILTGRITERQRDTDTGEYKYLVTGSTLAGERLTAVAKIADSGSLVVITVFLV